MLKYVYASPQPFPLYLIGRGAAQLGSAAASVLIVLVSTTVVLRLPIDPFRVNYLLLGLACLLAFVAIVSVAMGYSLSLLAVRDSYGYGELAAQMLFIVSGAIFPLSVLPGPLAALASVSPLVYWLELVRRALLQGNAFRMFPLLSDSAAVVRLLLTTILTIAFAYGLYRWADHRARRIGLIDLETNW